LRNIAIIYQDSAAPNAVAEGLRRKAKELGLTIVMDEAYPTDATDFTTTTMAKAKRVGAEVVAGGGYINDDIGLTKAAKAVDFNVRMICLMVGTADPNFNKELGKDAEFVMGNTNWEPYFNTPGNEDFVRRYKAKYNEDPYYDTAASYAAFMLLVEGVQKVGRLDLEALRTGSPRRRRRRSSVITGWTATDCRSRSSRPSFSGRRASGSSSGRRSCAPAHL
jgi:branched-chain amino acid transport system substrate-binding protein